MTKDSNCSDGGRDYNGYLIFSNDVYYCYAMRYLFGDVCFLSGYNWSGKYNGEFLSDFAMRKIIIIDGDFFCNNRASLLFFKRWLESLYVYSKVIISLDVNKKTNFKGCVGVVNKDDRVGEYKSSLLRSVVAPHLKIMHKNRLTLTEIIIVKKLSVGMDYHRIGNTLGYSYKTISSKCKVIYGKLGVSTLHEFRITLTNVRKITVETLAFVPVALL
ncbi:Uncharacterised protein [Serratia quinivorans]|uniref:helix-turn-helix transcriptional regulator n=1 Tax=Serratia quinivorans TaxID=137545 RepID=UPI00217B4E8A|nr:hypothetical protein [Serratia quinivorans]CAI1927514.1 Uncharacterised protein [Serratia quinivorans]